MTDTDRAARLSAALEASLDEATVYSPAEMCPQGHSNRDPECGGFLEAVGAPCPDCRSQHVHWPAMQGLSEAARQGAQDRWWKRRERWNATAPSQYRIGRGTPVNWDDPAILWPRWERWEAAECREDRSHLVLLDYDDRTTPGIWGATVMGWVAQVYGPSAAAALATAWDALLAREVRDGE